MADPAEPAIDGTGFPPGLVVMSQQVSTLEIRYGRRRELGGQNVGESVFAGFDDRAE